MPVLHWRDQARLDEKNQRLAKKTQRTSSNKYKVIIDDENNNNNNLDNDDRAETEPLAQTDINILPGSPKKQQRLSKIKLQEENTKAMTQGYDTVDTVTGPSADELENSLVSESEFNINDKDKTGKTNTQEVPSPPQLNSPEKQTTTKRKGNQSETDEEVATDEEEGPEIDEDTQKYGDDEIQSGYDSSLEYDIDYKHELNEIDQKDLSVPEIDSIKLWRDQRSEDLADKAMRQCNNCGKQLAAWRCHGCNYTYCEECNRDTHMMYCLKYRKRDHIMQRIDGRPLACGRCRKGVWEIAKYGYDHFNHQYKTKRRQMKHKRMKEEMALLSEKVNAQRSVFKQERKGHRLRQAQLDKLANTTAVGKKKADETIEKECDAYFAPMMTPLHFDPSQLELQMGENGRPLLPPPLDKESGRSVAMFSFDFNRNAIMCRACNIFWNSGPTFGRRVVVNAYAPVGPVIDPNAAARRSVQRIHDSKIHARMLEKLRLEGLERLRLEAIARNKPKKKTCVIM